MTERPFHFRAGTAPLLISIPHLGTELPDEVAAKMRPYAAEVCDAGWHLDRLYNFAESMGASVLSGRYSRYVVDLDRAPADEGLVGEHATTGLFPTETLRGDPLYRNGAELAPPVRAARLHQYWAPYHEQLRTELQRLKAAHGAVLLWEAHCIASVLPRWFEGRLPDLNLGTHGGASCSVDIQDAVIQALKGQPFSWVLNGRFRGGYIARQYGDPEGGVHAVQLEMCQATYMNEFAPFSYRSDLADRVRPAVQRMVEAASRALTARTFRA